MIRQSEGRGEVKKRQKRSGAAAHHGMRRVVHGHQEVVEDIDPAEFFDPEEFSVGRRDTQKR